MEPSVGTAEVFAAADLPNPVRNAMHRLFDESYDHADHGYLDNSLKLLRFAAIAVADEVTGGAAALTNRGGEIVGFALGETRALDLPGLPDQKVGLAGLCCVHSEFRRRGLFRSLERSVIVEGMGRLGNGRLLAAGRMAHPASLRIMRGNPSALPRLGVTPTAFQREIGRSVAACYGAEDFDPLTFVCRGPGRPLGYPRIDIEASAEEWELFANVDRDRGDSLLALSWLPDAPPGWQPGPASAQSGHPGAKAPAGPGHRPHRL